MRGHEGTCTDHSSLPAFLADYFTNSSQFSHKSNTNVFYHKTIKRNKERQRVPGRQKATESARRITKGGIDHENEQI